MLGSGGRKLFKYLGGWSNENVSLQNIMKTRVGEELHTFGAMKKYFYVRSLHANVIKELYGEA